MRRRGYEEASKSPQKELTNIEEKVKKSHIFSNVRPYVRASVRPSVPSCFWLKKRRFVIVISLKKDVIFGCPAEIHKSALKNAQQCGDLFRKRLIFGEVCCLMGGMSEGMG